MTLKNIIFASAFLYGVCLINDAHSMKSFQEEEKQISYEKNLVPYSRLSKIAALYVDAINTLDENTFSTLNKIFKQEYKDEELQTEKDISYSASNFLDSTTISFLEKTHFPFLQNFLKDENIQQVNDFNIKQSLMFMSHDIRVTKESLKTREKAKEMSTIIAAVGKLYLVMNDQRKERGRQVVGNGTGTFVQNEQGRDFILSCAHFPQSMEKYDENFLFEMFFFPHHLLDQEKNWPKGTDKNEIPFEKYENLKVTAINYQKDTLVQFLGEKELTYVPSLSDKHISSLRKVQEGKKDFACFLEKTPESVIPMQFAEFSLYSDSSIYYTCGYPCWGMSDNTFIITEGKKNKGEAHKIPFSFPAMHGMSGGPIFIYDEDLQQFLIISILMGVDNTSLQTVGYPINATDVVFLNEIK